jgi:multiple sugar transport system permease protein
MSSALARWTIPAYRIANRIDGRILLFRIFRLAFLAGVSFIVLFPVLHKLVQSFMSEADIMDVNRVWIPSKLSLLNYRIVMVSLDYFHNALRSLGLTLLVCVSQMASSTFVAYGLARFRNRLTNVLFAIAVFSMVIPPQLLMVPLVFNFRYFSFFGLFPEGLNLTGSILPFVLTSLTCMGYKNGIFIYIMRQVFKGIPRDLEDAAYVDGSGYLNTFARIVLPSATSGLLVVFLLAFVWQWSDLTFTELFLPNQELLSTVMVGFGFQYEDWYVAFNAGARPHPGFVAAIVNTAMLVFILPVLVLYLFVQRWFIKSVDRVGLVG